MGDRHDKWNWKCSRKNGAKGNGKSHWFGSRKSAGWHGTPFPGILAWVTWGSSTCSSKMSLLSSRWHNQLNYSQLSVLWGGWPTAKTKPLLTTTRRWVEVMWFSGFDQQRSEIQSYNPWWFVYSVTFIRKHKCGCFFCCLVFALSVVNLHKII